ncbi:hypothetical protein UNDYM_2577 [Undibacterium sp. YM2]|uniref:hypothetical protein n=1 Tax=Undibacterium sp. YM2 TaxID=2058625 RepID=UPI001331D5D8|nr:hypothetical protein [Undibacterium sp. YM2]BBB66830.1 hypothetical protein UNDYM_2577 [Undibacterium sp. YM2]
MKLIKKIVAFGAVSAAGVQSALAAGPTPIDLTPLTSQFDPAPINSAVMQMASGLMAIAMVVMAVAYVLHMTKKK